MAADRLRICLVIDRLAGRSGGAERVLVETANRLAGRGHEVQVVTHEPRKGPPFFPLAFGIVHTNLRRPQEARSRLRRRLDRRRESFQRRFETAGFPIDHAVWLSKHGGFWRRLERHLAAHEPDVAVAFLPPAIVALGLAQPSPGLRRIASIHNVPGHDLADPGRWDPSALDRRRRMEALGHMDAITVLLPEFRDWFPGELRDRVAVVPNAVRPISHARIRLHQPREKLALSVGRLAGVKRHGLLIEAWARLAQTFPDWRLRIYGTGPLTEELDARINALGLADKVRLMGHTDAIDEAYLAASLLVHPAEHEGWGLAVTEAMAAGVPAVGFADCPGVNQLIRDGETGLLVPGGGDRVAALAAALAGLMGDEPRRAAMAEAAPASVRAFHPDRVTDRWEAVLSGDAPE